MIDEGTIDITLAHDLAGLAEGDREMLGDARRKAMTALSYMFHRAEVLNRQVTFVAGYRLAKKAALGKGRSASDAHEAGIDYGRKIVYDSHFDYTADNRPRYMQGNVARVVTMFKQFSQNMIYQMGRSLQQMIKGESPEVRQLAKRNLVGILGTHAVLSGTMGLPLFSTVMFALNALFGDDDEPFDAETEYRNFLADHLGQTTGEVIAKGLPRAMLPADVASRISLDGLLFKEDRVQDLEGQALYTGVMEQALGPVFGGAVPGMFRGAKMMSEGQVTRGAEQFLPKFARDIMKDYRYAKEGVLDIRGNEILDDLTPGESITQLLGFSPARLSEHYAAKRAVKSKQTKLNRRRTILLRQYHLAKQAGDTDEVNEVMSRISRFNDKNPEIRITRLTLSRSAKKRAQRQREAVKGIYVPRKRRELIEEGRFGLE